MTPEEFKSWRSGLKLSQQEAADKLGLSKSTIELYERGSRRDDGRPVEIPTYIELACQAITYMSNNPVPAGHVEVFTALVYNVATDSYTETHSKWTREAIATMPGRVVETSGVVVPVGVVDADGKLDVKVAEELKRRRSLGELREERGR